MRVPLTLLSESYRNTRALQPEKVAALASGIERLGLQTPISVRAIKSVRSGQTVDAWAIVTGRHRVAAARKLGWTEIEATLFDGDEIDARLWQLAENLHRAELTALERAENEAEWIRLTEEKNDGPSWADIPRGRGQPQGGINAATRELGITRQEGQRAAKIASLSAEAKETARQAGLDDNQAALLAAAKKSEAAAQVAAIREIAERGAVKPVKPAPPPLNDFEVEENGFAAFMRVWNSASPNLRQRIRDFIDAPVFDQTRAA